MTTKTYHVRPSSSRHEALVVFTITLMLSAGLTLYVSERGRNEEVEVLHTWQVSAFRSLAGADQAIYNSLYTVKDEIPYIYESINRWNEPGVKFRWPNLEDFQDYLLPPFLQDTSWEQNGSLQWSLYEPLPEGEMQGSTMYLGTDGTLPDQGSFLLVISHVHAGFTNSNPAVIWWNEAHHAEMPQSGFRDSLILRGWRNVVPYSGGQEVERIYGE